MAKQEVSPIGRYCFGSIRDLAEDLSKRPAWEAHIEIDDKLAAGMFEIVEQTISEGYKKFSSAWPKDMDKLNRPFKPATDKSESGVRVPKEGFHLWKFKRMGFKTGNDGKKQKNTPPQIISAKGVVCKTDERPNVGNGSTGKVIFAPYPYSIAGQNGVGFRLIGFQIAELRETEEVISLPPIEGGWEPEGRETDIDLSALVSA